MIDPATRKTADPAEGALYSQWETPPTSLDWHVWMYCNLACQFCFKTLPGFLASKPPTASAYLPLEEAKHVVHLLREAGFTKITFAGGEPTLHPRLPELIHHADELGFTVMLVTNGHFLSDGYLDRVADSLDAVKISIDSADEAVQRALGRGKGDHVARATAAASLVKAHGVPLMVNTVVTALNWKEDLTPLIRRLAPVRWKVFQALREEGENEAFRGWATSHQFQRFLATNAGASPVAEPNGLMRGSYIMMDPLGRFMQDSTGRYEYSRPVSTVGVIPALEEVGWDSAVFLQRGGLYAWSELRRREPTRPRTGESTHVL